MLPKKSALQKAKKNVGIKNKERNILKTFVVGQKPELRNRGLLELYLTLENTPCSRNGECYLLGPNSHKCKYLKGFKISIVIDYWQSVTK